MALTRAQGDDVLRYWLASLRLEEALQVRPAARQSGGGAAVPRVDQPTPGQEYFKLPLDAALASLLAKQGQVTRSFDPELSAFFETWLHRQYRRSEDESELSHLLCFPVVHLPKGELAGLVRCGVRLRFGSGSSVFRAPTRAERQRGTFPAAPTEGRLTRAPRAEGTWPCFIDTRLLRQPLGVPTETIDAFFEALRTLKEVTEPQMLALSTVMLESAMGSSGDEPESVASRASRLTELAAKEPLDAEAWLSRLTAAVQRLLQRSGSRARVYPVAIVVDGTQAKTTWHLQRELEALVETERGRWKVDSPLGAYLTGKPLSAGEGPQRALLPGPALTTSQRAAAEAFWGSSFCAVQGPPGTGKTRLILQLCAEQVLRQTEALLGLARESAGMLLITSSNNRAVDNVIEPLTAGSGLPLALRAGSRQVCEHQLAAQLRRTLGWLKRAEAEPALERRARLERASSGFRVHAEALNQVLEPRRAALERAAERARLVQELAECAPPDGDAVKVSPAATRALVLALEPLEKRLRALSQLCEAEAAPSSLRSVEQHYQRTSKRQLRAVQEALQSESLSLELPLPPAEASRRTPEQAMEAWEEAAEVAISRVTELRVALHQAANQTTRAERARQLGAQLEALGPEPTSTPEVGDHEQLSRELLEAAVAAREAWASDRAAELSAAVAVALRTVEQERSLRPLFRNEPDAARLLCRLFRIWGSTLLSLGNCFPNELGSLARVVIDEAGQCHPAHAVSALLRAESALVIGDVHQLSPVIELGADDDARLLRACRLATPAPLLRPYRVHADAEVSSQSVADRAVRKRGSLTDHFRCQPEIIAVSDALCGYGLAVHTLRADRRRQAPFLAHPVLHVDLRGEQVPLAGSWCNELELQETLTLVESLLHGGVQLDELAVITPYRGQLERLRRGLLERRIPVESSAELAEGGAPGLPRAGVALGTVHRFQGGERSIVLFSAVVSRPSSLGFLNARPNLLNVAVSRAQHHFVCLGHRAVLAQGARSRLLTDAAVALTPTAYGGGQPSGSSLAFEL
ncbi:MAG: hypothetical protein EOO73_23350 [Myxococcales bacterium]|nr:MAG: hypothetical protein EOO73_23350 [Myxococcales bacterium]